MDMLRVQQSYIRDHHVRVVLAWSANAPAQLVDQTAADVLVMVTRAENLARMWVVLGDSADVDEHGEFVRAFARAYDLEDIKILATAVRQQHLRDINRKA